jgi:hypothetical protein
MIKLRLLWAGYGMLAGIVVAYVFDHVIIRL